jgi:hypothetical protein
MQANSHKDSDISRAMIVGLSELWRCRIEDVQARIGDKGREIQLSAKLAMTVGAIMERELGRGVIFVPNDFATDTTRIPAGKSQVSPNGCMDPAEDVSLSRIFDITKRKLGMTA